MDFQELQLGASVYFDVQVEQNPAPGACIGHAVGQQDFFHLEVCAVISTIPHSHLLG